MIIRDVRENLLAYADSGSKLDAGAITALKKAQSNGLWVIAYKRRGRQFYRTYDPRKPPTQKQVKAREEFKKLVKHGTMKELREKAAAEKKKDDELRKRWAELNGDEFFGTTYDKFKKMTAEAIEELARKDERFAEFLQGWVLL